MLKCAIITPGFLPVPAVDGGAIEMLVTNLIEANEKEEYFIVMPNARKIFKCFKGEN